MPALRKVALSSLYVSRPNPVYFGNPGNPAKGSAELALWTDANWLRSRFHFQFAESDDSIPSNFGVLRVLNDDLVQPRRGFGTHPHADMEIATIILHGELTHKDSMGTRETLSRGSVQYMSAGKGVRHSEFNLHPTSPLRFLQLWIVPNARGLTPNYGSYHGETDEAIVARKNKWQHLVSGVSAKQAAAASASSDVPIKLHQDVNIYLAEVEEGQTVEFTVLKGRQVYFVQAEGKATMTDGKSTLELSEGDSTEIIGPVSFQLKVTENDKRANPGGGLPIATPSIVVAVEMAYSGDTRFSPSDFSASSKEL